MNLVAIQNVVSAIEYFIDCDEQFHGDIYLISDDERINNNYRYIEKRFFKKCGYNDYILPFVPLPNIIIQLLLALVGKTNTNPDCVYDCKKILNVGYQKAIPFEDALDEYFAWYKNLNNQKVSKNNEVHFITDNYDMYNLPLTQIGLDDK